MLAFKLLVCVRYIGTRREGDNLPQKGKKNIMLKRSRGGTRLGRPNRGGKGNMEKDNYQ